MFCSHVTLSGYPLHSLVSPSLHHPCVTVCHHISNAVYSVASRLAEQTAGNSYSLQHYGGNLIWKQRAVYLTTVLGLKLFNDATTHAAINRPVTSNLIRFSTSGESKKS